jgi:hypothetical protein
MSLLNAEQRALRQKIADDLRDDSNAVRIHIDLSKYLAADPDNLDAGLWTDTVDVPIRDIKIEVDGGNPTAHQDAHDYLIRILELKIKAMIPGLCREILGDATARSQHVLTARSGLAAKASATPRAQTAIFNSPDMGVADDFRELLASSDGGVGTSEADRKLGDMFR